LATGIPSKPPSSQAKAFSVKSGIFFLLAAALETSALAPPSSAAGLPEQLVQVPPVAVEPVVWLVDSWDGRTSEPL
jgi:hypothetical protein